jgi:hypothetical protein
MPDTSGTFIPWFSLSSFFVPTATEVGTARIDDHSISNRFSTDQHPKSHFASIGQR